MLGGVDPILIFQLYKLVPSTVDKLAKIPLTSQVKKKATAAIIPIYLSESITGILLDNQSKNIDINTDMEGITVGEQGPINQKPLGSVTTINLIAKEGSIGLTILLALSEIILDKVVSQEYEVTYMKGATTVFGGLIHGFSYETEEGTDKMKIKIEISKGRQITKSVVVANDSSAVRLASQGTSPPASAPTVSAPPAGGAGSSAIQPRLP